MPMVLVAMSMGMGLSMRVSPMEVGEGVVPMSLGRRHVAVRMRNDDPLAGQKACNCQECNAASEHRHEP